MEIICIIGPESSGKTTLAQHIAHTRNAIYIPEYARLYTEMLLQHGREYTYADVCRIAMHQMNEWEKLGEREFFGGCKREYEGSERVFFGGDSVCEREVEGGERVFEGVSQNRTVVMDTEWIVTQVWFEEVYEQTPDGWHLPELYTHGGQSKDSNSLTPKSEAESEDSGAKSEDSGAKERESSPIGAINTTQIRFLLTAPDIEWVADPVRENGSDERRWYLFHRYEEWLKKIGAHYEIVWHK